MVTFVGKNITAGRKVFSSKSKWRRKTKAKERRLKSKKGKGRLGTGSASLALEKWGRQDSNIQGHPWLHGKSEASLDYRDLVSKKGQVRRRRKEGKRKGRERDERREKKGGGRGERNAEFCSTIS